MEKELNQTTSEQEVKVEEQSAPKDNIAEIRQKIEKRYEDKLTKAQAEFIAQLDAANQELKFYKEELPQLQQAYVKNGGNKDYFND